MDIAAGMGRGVWIFGLIGMFVRSRRIGIRMGIVVGVLIFCWCDACYCSHSLIDASFLPVCRSLFIGTGPDFFDCRYDEHGDGKCHKVEFQPHHDHGL